MKRTSRANRTYKSKASSPALLTAVAGLLLTFAGSVESAELGFVETLHQNAASGELTSIARVQDIALSPEGTHAYVSGDVLIHPLNGFVSDAAISVFSVNATTGALSIVQSVNVVTDQTNQIGTRDVLVSPSGRHVYSTGDTFLSLFERDPVSGLLNAVETLTGDAGALLDLSGSVALAMDTEGRQVYVAAGNGSAILTFQRDTTTGTLTLDSVIHDGEGGVSGLTNLLALEMSPDGHFLYAAADELVVFARDPDTGDLGFIEAVSRANPGNSCASDILAISTDGHHVYLGAEIFQRDATSGTLTASGLADDSGASDTYKFLPICATAVSRDGNHYYEARRFFFLSAGIGSSTVENLGVYQRDPTTGALSFLEEFRTGGSTSLVVSPGEGYVYTAGTPLRTSFVFPDPVVSVFSRVTPPPSDLAAAILPGSRSVQVGGLATAFASIINQGAEVAHRCTMALETAVPADFDFHATDPLTNLAVGLQNTPLDILSGAARTLVFAVAPSAPIQPQALSLRFSCADRSPVPVLDGINTFFLAAATEASADVIAIASTIDNDGIVKVPGVNTQGIFAVATANVVAGAMITVSADPGGASLPVEISICEADQATATCLPASSPGNPIMTQIDANETNTFVVFVHSIDAVSFNPETNRIFIRFQDEGGTLRGVTSVAVTTEL